MIDDIGGATSQIVKLALDAALQRHNVIANNIANANTPGFIPHEMKFETVLAQLKTSSEVLHGDSLIQDVDYLRDEVNRGKFIERKETDKVELDVEIADMAENVIKYRALLEGLSKRSSIIHMAISGQGR